MIKNTKPLHPGQVLKEIYMTEMNLNQTSLAEKCNCAPRKINEIVNQKRSISPEFALILESVLGTSAEMWVRMQADYDLWEARKNTKQMQLEKQTEVPIHIGINLNDVGIILKQNRSCFMNLI